MAHIGEFETSLQSCLTDQDGSLVLSLRVPKAAAYATRQTVAAINKGRQDGKERLKIRFFWHKDKRSLSANSYFHVLVDKIAQVMGLSAEEVKTRMVLDYGTPKLDGDGDREIALLPKSSDPKDYYPYAKWIGDTTAKNGKAYSQYFLYKQTHTLDKSEMARLIDGVVQEAQQLDIETRTPQELAALLDGWEAHG